MLDFFSTLYFWFLFFMIGYWFIFFKLQERVFLFMPTHLTYWDNFKQYDYLFGFVTASKLLYVIVTVVLNSEFDVFLIDWERPKPQKNQIPLFEDDKVPDVKNRLEAKRETAEKKDVNAWRSLFLVNELKEIQTYKVISTNMTLILYALFM